MSATALQPARVIATTGASAYVTPAPASAFAAAVSDALTTAVVAFDDDGQRLYANAGFDRCFGEQAPPQCTRAHFEQLFRVAGWSGGVQAGAEGAAAEWHHPGSGRWYAVTRATARFEGQVLHVFELADISQRMADERQRSSQHEQLLFTSKVMSVGEMAATLAHELNQPIGSLLNFMNGCVMRLERTNADPKELHAALLEARQQCERAAAIITRIRQFVRAREPRMQAVDLGEVCRAVIGMLDAEVKRHHVHVKLDLPTAVPAVLADRVMLEQVLHNLAKNAIDAMRTQRPPRRLLIGAAPLRDGLIEVSVQDSGPGVAESARSQLFSPFFTTKADGLGIGLNICRSMIEFHGGSLYFERCDGGGSRFAFTVPAHRGEPS
jgi:C4-dicarboxylate-specific signal transduction histidine kinase